MPSEAQRQAMFEQDQGHMETKIRETQERERLAAMMPRPPSEIEEAIGAMEDLHMAAMTLIRRGQPGLGWKTLGAVRDLAKPLMAKGEAEGEE